MTREPWGLVTLPTRSRPIPVSGYMRVVENRPTNDRYMAVTLEAPEIAASAKPGQFVMMTAAHRGEATPALPRPMAIYSVDTAQGTIEILYGVVGFGTARLASFEPADERYVVGPLGRGFDVADSVRRVLLVGRGIGTCSLTTVAQTNVARGIETIAVTSGREPGALIGEDFYRSHDATAIYAVVDRDGTSSPDALFAQLTADWDDMPPELILTCGSARLTRLCESLSARWGAGLQVSVEAHMACGLGYCHGCASGARSEGNESPLICKDGPVFSWQPMLRTEAL
jgi:dihydroorotate dehydrogenase electron transfer subunit